MSRPVRPFAPASFCFDDEQVKCMIEARLEHSGEYVRHLPSDGTPQWVVMNYQYIPQADQTGEGYSVPGIKPMLYGLIDHFEASPTIRRQKRNEESGSLFVVRGITYSVKSVEIHSRCGVRIEIARSEKCTEPDPAFFEEVDGLLCSSEPHCGNTLR